MDDKEIKLKPVKEKKFKIGTITKLFEDKKKRYFYMFLFMLPFLIAIAIFGFITYKEAMNLINMAKGETVIKNENLIESMNYVLRDNATDIQKEYFKQLKSAIEEGYVEENGEQVAANDLKIVELVAKNYVADFYTWTNKLGQYDVGGMYYVFDRYNESIKFKDNIYQNARDGFYKYINYYANQYDFENLIEVENVEVTTCKKADYKYIQNVWTKTLGDENTGYEAVYEDVEFDAYDVTCKWTYKPETSLNINNFASSINLLIIEDDGRYKIVEASETRIDERREESADEDESDSEQTEESESSKDE